MVLVFIWVEVSDVVNVVFDGIDVVMLLVEIVIGYDFVFVIEIMVCIAQWVESMVNYL